MHSDSHSDIKMIRHKLRDIMPGTCILITTKYSLHCIDMYAAASKRPIIE